MNYKIVLFFLILITSLHAGTITAQKKPYVGIKHKLACASTEKAAIIKVDKVLASIIGVDSPHLYSKNVYIRHKKNSRGAFCVEGVVTQEGLDIYSAQLEDEYETIMGEIEDLNDGISYNHKAAEVERLEGEVKAYNFKVKAAKALGKCDVPYINATKKRLDKMINAIPVVTFKVQGCKGKYITGCRMVFVSNFEDDSSQVVYHWDFGDRTQSRRTNPIHYYKRAGTYTVKLRITDGGKKFKEVSKRIRIASKPKPRKKVRPIASFSAKKKFYTPNEMITFINLSSSEKAKLTDYRWNFGDGKKSKVCTPHHSYSKPGLYKVHLEVANSDGLKSDDVETVHVVDPAILFAIDGRKYNRVVRKFGQPDAKVVKKGSLTKAYRYGVDWLLVKQNKVECRIKGGGFKTNLMGNPKNCHWYEKHAPSSMIIIE